jgi:hypothetical protein
MVSIPILSNVCTRIRNLYYYSVFHAPLSPCVRLMRFIYAISYAIPLRVAREWCPTSAARLFRKMYDRVVRA